MTIPHIKSNIGINSSTVQARAAASLRITKRMKELAATLEEDKVYFRDLAAGETIKIEVPNVGAVSVNKGAAPKSGTTLVFDEDKYNALPSDTKMFLQTLGVVTTQSFSKPAGTPSVTFSLNV